MSDLKIPKSAALRAHDAIVDIGMSPMMTLYLIITARALNTRRGRTGDYHVWTGLGAIARRMNVSRSTAHRLKWEADAKGYIVVLPVEHEKQRNRRGGRRTDNILIDIRTLEEKAGFINGPRDDIAKVVGEDAAKWRKIIAESDVSGQRSGRGRNRKRF